VCVGYRAELITAFIRDTGYSTVDTVTNEAYREGSIVSLWTARDVLRAGDDIILMDADVLYTAEIMARLVAAPASNRFLCDRDFEPGDEPVKICLLDYNDCGESVGFFSLTAAMAARLAEIADSYVTAGRREEPYEEAIRDLALAAPDEFRVEDVTGLPWIEIDFPEDIIRANDTILPQIL